MARINNTEAPATSGKGTRTRKSPEQKAVAELDAAIKTRDLAAKKLDKLKLGMAPAQTAFDHAEARVAFLSQNPDLPEDRRATPAAQPENDEAPVDDSAQAPDA